MNKGLLLTLLVSTLAAAQPATPPEKPAADVPVETKEDPGGRIRWGASGSVGWHVPAPALTFGGEGRIGYQVSKMFSAYLAVGGTAGVGFGVSAGFEGATVSVTAISYYYFGALAELYLGNLFFVAGGPVLANGGYGGATMGASSSGVAEQNIIASGGIKPGLNIRLGLGLPGPAKPSFRRGGFTLGVDTMILFHLNSTIVTQRADGPNGTAGASVTTTGTTVSIVPMLMIGYDGR